MYDVVRTRIIDGVYLPGQVLNESEMAQELAVSRTPVSQALIMLRERGLVVDRHGRLAVSRLTKQGVVDLYRCRMAFDGLATRLAAERVSRGDLEALAADLRMWRDAGVEDDLEALWVADLGFHERIYKLSDNAHLVRFASTATDLLAIYRHGTIHSLARSGEPAVPRTRDHVHAEHQRILAALAARDPAAAERAARDHIEQVIAHLATLDVVADPESATAA